MNPRAGIDKDYYPNRYWCLRLSHITRHATFFCDQFRTLRCQLGYLAFSRCATFTERARE